MFSPTLLSLFTAAAALLAPLAAADFYISNTTVCLGAFPLDGCQAGATVLTAGWDYNASYTCAQLGPAQDAAYIVNGTAGPFGSPYVASSAAVCGVGPLRFVKDRESYFVEDARGAFVGDCAWDDALRRGCPEFLGGRYFQTMYRCSSSVCGD